MDKPTPEKVAEALDRVDIDDGEWVGPAAVILAAAYRAKVEELAKAHDLLLDRDDLAFDDLTREQLLGRVVKREAERDEARRERDEATEKAANAEMDSFKALKDELKDAEAVGKGMIIGAKLHLEEIKALEAKFASLATVVALVRAQHTDENTGRLLHAACKICIALAQEPKP